jgi:hypothetical protein
MFHAADCRTSDRLKSAVAFVKRFTESRFTPWDLSNWTGCNNPTGILSELSHAKNGFQFDRAEVKENGKRVSYYKTTQIPEDLK